MAECLEATPDLTSNNLVPVLYRSDNFLVVDKPFDLKINSDSEEDTLETRLRIQLPSLADPNVAHSFRFVHRLDYATSGVICLALNKKSAGQAAKCFQQRKVKKYYLAVVRGLVADSEKEIRTDIGRDSSIEDRCVMCTTENPHCTEPRPSHTTLRLLEHGTYDGDTASKLLLMPHTGRTHQLRVHCCMLGHPIVGDYTYSNRADTKPERMMLHALHLSVTMATEPISITTEDPFTHARDKLWIPDKVFDSVENVMKS